MRIRVLAIACLGVLLALALVGCASGGRNHPTAGVSPLSPLPVPEKNAAVMMKPEDGGSVRLYEGASLAVPRQSLSSSTLVTLRAVGGSPVAPVPLNFIGQAYDVGLDGGTLAGIALLTLPLPPDVRQDQYDLAPYHWNGRAWERMEGRPVEQAIQVGVDVPGTYALLGTWRMADANMEITLTSASTGQDTFPVEVRGQYRYRALPALQHDYVQARLALKRDSSGGAGQVNGNDQLDQTVAETVIWFRPDPAKAEGTIDFSYTFQIDPLSLGVPLGSVSQFYAFLSVADSAAPTRRFSGAVQSVTQMTLQVNGTDVVRPDVANNRQDLLWHVRLDGRTLFRRPASGLTLSLAEALAQGGLGEYRITVEAEYQGKYIPVSNEITVQLALPGTVTPSAAARWPFGTMPPTPTRRTPPNGQPSSLDYGTPAVVATEEATATPTPATTPTPTRSVGSVFWADREVIAAGECTTLHWNVENVSAVYLDGSSTTGNNSKQVCPAWGTTYVLQVVDGQGNTQDYRVTVTLQGGSQGAVDFSVDRSQITQGECTSLHWRAANVKAVFLNDQGVAGEATQEVCPRDTTTYVLEVVDREDNQSTRQLTVRVLPAGTISLQFWADQYALSPGSCTTLHWNVENVQAVYLRMSGQETGVGGQNGSQRVCPNGNETYTLRATTSDEHENHKDITLLVGDFSLGPKELIAQGVVTSVEEVADLDSNTAGDLAGFKIVVDGVAPLFRGNNDCCQSKMTLLLMRSLTQDQFLDRIDWPIRAGQQIEFWLSPCTTGECKVFNVPSRFYLKARSG